MWGGILRGIAGARRIKRRRSYHKSKIRQLDERKTGIIGKLRDEKSKMIKSRLNRPKMRFADENFLNEEKRRREFHKKEMSVKTIAISEARKFLGNEVAKNPFMAIIDKEKFCKERKRKRKEIMKKTAGKGLKIKKAIWTPISKLVKCERKK